MLPLSLHVQMVRLSFFYGFYGSLRTINLRSRLTILSNFKSPHVIRKEKARSSWCCGVFFTHVKNVKVFVFLSRRAMVILKG